MRTLRDEYTDESIIVQDPAAGLGGGLEEGGIQGDESSDQD